MSIQPPTASDAASAGAPRSAATQLSLPVPPEWLAVLASALVPLVTAHENTEPEYMTTNQVAEYLGWSKKRIDNLCAQRRIPFKKDGNRRIFIRQQIDEWVGQLDGPSVYEALLSSL
jgi:excisionase family DNA binding protein